jgi:ketosteroid isomerase-like protein
MLNTILLLLLVEKDMEKFSSSQEIVESYLRALGNRDIAKIKTLLSKDTFSFIGPIDRFNNAEDLTKALQNLAPIVTGVQIRKTFVDDGDVCSAYNLNTSTPAGSVRCTELCHVENGKITSTEVFFDASPFRQTAGKY